MKIFILKDEPDKDNIVTLTGNDYKHLVKVRRLAVGESFPVLLPNGEEKIIKVTTINKSVLTGECVNASSSAVRCPLSAVRLILFQALPKGDKMDLIARQAAETGIAEIVPFVSEFSIARKKKNGAVGDAKFTRWQRIIKEARQQSGSKTATVIHKPLTIKELFEYWESIKEKSVGLLFHHQKCHQKGVEKNSLHGYLNNIDINKNNAVIAIGPEGGFSDAEVSLFIENSFNAFTIGESILRTETAALYCASAVKIILLEKDSWQMK